LSERDGQLRGLIENSNRVFATTAARNRELADTFRVLPTFERESTLTVNRLPALTRFNDELHPLLGETDEPLRQLNPILGFVGAYPKELTAFFANVVASTQATTGVGADAVHYLRTTNPTNPENLAVYPRRIGTNRPNPYQFPGAFSALASGLPQYETRHCAHGVATLVTQPLPAGTLPPVPTLIPTIPGLPPIVPPAVPSVSDPTALIPAPLAANIQRFFYA